MISDILGSEGAKGAKGDLEKTRRLRQAVVQLDCSTQCSTEYNAKDKYS